MHSAARTPLGLTLWEVMGRVGLLAGLLIVALVGLYLLKNKVGSQGWRVKVPTGMHRAVTFVVWLVAKKVPWKPLLIWGPWVAMTLVAGFYGIESWRGKRAWETVVADLRGRGEEFDLEALVPPAIPDEENFAKDPAVLKEAMLTRSDPIPPLYRIGGVRRASPVNNRDLGVHLDVRLWMERPGDYASSREAAEAVLGLLEPYRARLDALAGARFRPQWHLPWTYSRSGDPRYWDLDPADQIQFEWWRAFKIRALLRLASDDLAGAIEDFRSCVRLTHYAAGMQGMSYYRREDGRAAELDALVWELLSHPGVDPDLLQDLEPVLAGVDTRRAMVRGLKIERAFSLAMLDYWAGHRKEAEELLDGVSFVDLTRDWTPDWVDNFDDGVNWFLRRIAPRGWYSHWKVRLVFLYDELLLRPDGTDVERMEVDAERRIDAMSEGLGNSFSDQLMRDLFAYTGYRVSGVVQHQVRIDLMRIALGLERYRKRAGRYPESLGGLVPDFLPALPDDPFTEEAYRYRLKADGTPLVWSVGGNRIDDGGIPAAIRTSDPRLDMVWQYTGSEGQTERMWMRGEKP